MGVIKGDTRSLDYSSLEVIALLEVIAILKHTPPMTTAYGRLLRFRV